MAVSFESPGSASQTDSTTPAEILKESSRVSAELTEIGNGSKFEISPSKCSIFSCTHNPQIYCMVIVVGLSYFKPSCL